MTASYGASRAFSWGTSRALNELAAATADTFTLRYEVRPPIAHRRVARLFVAPRLGVEPECLGPRLALLGVPAAVGIGQLPGRGTVATNDQIAKHPATPNPGVPVTAGSPESPAGIPLRKTCANSFMAMADESSCPGTGAAPAVEV